VSYVVDRLITGIVGSHLTRGMNVCPSLSMSRSPVQVETLRWADPPSEESYKNI